MGRVDRLSGEKEIGVGGESSPPPGSLTLATLPTATRGEGKENYPNTSCSTPFFTTTVLSKVIVVFITGRSKCPAV